MARIPIALQLFSVRHDCERDLEGTLRAIAEMGYDGVEFAGYYGRSAEELRRLLDDAGLRCAGTHTRLETLAPENLADTVAFNRTLGNRFLVVPSLPEERRSSRAAWLETAALLNELAAAAGELGALVGYHNHFVEFEPLEGDEPMDLFPRNTRPEVVMQIDIGNAIHGGGDPLRYLRDYAERALTVHLKEYAGGYDRAIIGHGDVDWGEVFRICESSGATEWYIVEQSCQGYSAMDCVAACIRSLREMGK